MSRRLAVLAAALGVWGCAETGAPVAPRPAEGGPPPVAAASTAAGRRYDGSYVGRLGVADQQGGSATSCPPLTGERVLRISAGQVRISVAGRDYAGPVGADGSVDVEGLAPAGLPGRLQGKVGPEGFNGTLSYRYGTRATCSYPMDGFARRSS